MAHSDGISWADLPPEILFDIAGWLGSSIDVLSFRSVCSSWRRSFPGFRNLLSPYLPVKVPPSDFCSEWPMSQSLADCVVSAGCVYLVRAPADASSLDGPEFFLLFVGELVEGKLWLRNPLSKSLVSEMPCYLPKSINLFVDVHFLLVGKYFSLSSVPFNYKSLPPFKFFKQIIKVVVLSNGCKAAVLSEPGILRAVTFARGKWDVLSHSSAMNSDDLVEFEGKIYVVSRGGWLYAVGKDEFFEGDNLWSWELVVASSIRLGNRRKRLIISSSGELNLVVRCDGTTEFMVFKLRSEEYCEWEQLTSLGGQMFFLGMDFSFPISISTQGGVRVGNGNLCLKNCILSTEDSFPCHQDMDNPSSQKGIKDDLELCIFYLDDDNGPLPTWLHHLRFNKQLLLGSSCPAYSRLLWPPPTWLHHLRFNKHEAIRAEITRLREADQFAQARVRFFERAMFLCFFLSFLLSLLLFGLR